MIQKITDKHEKILEVAERLFEVNGFHATGVEEIVLKSGVTKRTLYKHFGSKEGLIEAVLSRHQSQAMNRIRKRVSEIAAEDGGRLLACFDLYQEWFSRPCFAGCIFIKTLNEFQQRSDRLFAIAAQAKSELRDYLTGIAEEAGVSDPEHLAEQLQIILEGSIVVAQCGRRTESIRIARELAEIVVAQQLPDQEKPG